MPSGDIKKALMSDVNTNNFTSPGAMTMQRNEGLVVKYVTVATADIDADFLTVFNESGLGKVLSSVNLTVDITVSGVNGLDNGAEANIWYYIWVIYDGTTTAGLLSASATAPTMPGLYTFKKLVGAVKNTAGDFISFHQKRNLVKTTNQTLFSAFVTASYTILDISTFIPAIAYEIGGNVKVYSSDMSNAEIMGFLSPENGDSGRVAVYHNDSAAANAQALEHNFSMYIETAQTIYRKVQYATYNTMEASLTWYKILI